MASISPAKILSQSSYLASGRLKITEHFFEVAKDYTKPEAGTIKVFARSARKHETFPNEAKNSEPLPWMLYLNGGPGSECRPPQNYGFTQTLLDKGYQVLFLDQRGTGLSTPVTASTLQMRGDTATQARYLRLYRADSIVADSEAIRLALTAELPADKQKWSLMAQSFGGFISTTYLSYHPSSLTEVFLFGGLQPLVAQPDAVYTATYAKLKHRNAAYYTKHPSDTARVKKILTYLSRFGDGAIKLPSSGSLTTRRFQQLGLYLGMHGGIDTIHDLVLRSAHDIEAFGHITRPSLSAIDRALPFDDALIYSILHEPIYCSGRGNAANWSAHRLREQYPEFDASRASASSSDEDTEPVFFTGEMIYPWMFSDYSELSKVQPVAEAVAAMDDWPELFDLEQLGRNEVPVFAAVYVEDMYVGYELSLQAAGRIRGCKVFSTNVMFHDAVRSRVDEVLRQAFGLRDDVVD